MLHFVDKYAGWMGHILTVSCITTVIILLPLGCSQATRPTPPGPTPSFTGPAFLHGTIGSMTRLLRHRPLLVSGYGLVVNLNGQGSAEVPAYLRQWLINDMRKKGVGSAALGTTGMTPAKMLASKNTSVVVVQGLIPAGATKGTRFDVLVSCLPQTQTTSLEGGRMWTTDLSVNGTNRSMRFSRKLGTAAGPMYINPFDHATPQEKRLQLQRQAVILSGGVVSVSRDIVLALNQPSWQRSRHMADRINERFPAAPSDRRPCAVAVDDAHIQLHVPARYAQQPDALIDLIRHLFVQQAPGFAESKAKQLAETLVAHPNHAQSVTHAWVALGKTILPTIRPYYDHLQQQVKLAALATGARLDDEAVASPLNRMAQLPDPEPRRQAAKLLVHLPRSVRGSKTLRSLLDDANIQVRLEAYESLAAIHDPLIDRKAIDGPGPDRFKFVLDLVPSPQPLIYITQNQWPRLVVFGQGLGFEAP